MKACLLQAVYALAGLLAATLYRDFSTICFLSLPEEEVPSRHHLPLLERLCQDHPSVLVFEGARSPGNIVVQRKGYTLLQLTAQGIAAQAGSTLEKGRSAVLEMAHQTVQFCTLGQSIEGLSINPAPRAEGALPNVVADYAEVSFDICFLREQDSQRAVSQWEAMLH
jgi:glutamate carboxypeptidase